MKKVIFTLTLFGILALSINATVRTVSNDPKAPAQYTGIQAAITASSPGDTILVYGYSTYGNIAIDREIILIGAGYNNPYGSNSLISNLYLNGGAGSLSASHSKITGFDITNIYFNGTNSAAKMIEGVLIDRCRLKYIDLNENTVTFRDDTIRNCLIYDSYVYFYYSVYENFLFHNCIFDNQYFYNPQAGKSLDSVIVRNCVFVNRASPNTVFSTARDLTIESSIFYAAEPSGCTNCAFNNNMTFLNSIDELDGIGNPGNPGSVGSGNHTGIDPGFVTFPPAGGRFSYTHDLNVTHADAINGGTDNTDMGIHGGLLPYTPGENPAIPQMTEIMFPGNASSVKVGGTLDVTFKAKKQD